VLLLLIALCKRKPELAKIFAFENIFEFLFDIIEEESSSSSFHHSDSFTSERSTSIDDLGPDAEALVVIHDCLHLMNNLLSGNPSNQSYFRETGCIPRLNPLLDLKGLTSRAATSIEDGTPSTARPITPQEARNLQLALKVVYLLVSDNSPDSRKNQDLCSSRGILKAVIRMCFSAIARDHPEVWVGSLDTLRALVQSNDENKRLMASIPAVVDASNRPKSALISAVDAFCSAASSAVRAAAYQLVLEVILSEGSIPSAGFLKALCSQTAPHSTTTGSTSSATSMGEAFQGLADLIKVKLVGWPDVSDGAAVFYCSSLISTVLLERDNARSELTRSSAKSDSLLSKVVRALSRAQREGGPAEVRIGLLKLLCIWMYGSTEAIAALLSSAMHLPLIVELIVHESTRRGDSAEVHVKGLAVLLLAICLESEEDNGAIPKNTLIDIIRNRIGIAVFTAKLDELRATDAFGAALLDNVQNETSPAILLEHEMGLDHNRSRRALSSSRGDLGHDRWYDKTFTSLFNDIYGKVYRHVVELVSLPSNKESSSHEFRPRNLEPDAASSAPIGATASRLGFEDASGTNEVLSSYKDIIREQDGSIATLKKELDEARKALVEAQTVFHADASSVSKKAESELAKAKDDLDRSKHEIQVLNTKMEELKVALEEKSQDNEAISRAFNDLEAEFYASQSQGLASGGASSVSSISSQEMEQLKTKLKEEKAKVEKLQKLLQQAEESGGDVEDELAALRKERDELKNILAGKSKSDPSKLMVDIAALRSRAEVAESSLNRHMDLCQEKDSEISELHESIAALEADKENVNSQNVQLSKHVIDLKSEISALTMSRNALERTSRKDMDELKVRYEHEISKLQSEIDSLRSSDLLDKIGQLEDALQAKEQEKQELDSSLKESTNQTLLLQSRIEDLQSSLDDARAAIEREKGEKKMEQSENSRLAKLVRDTEAKMSELDNSVKAERKSKDDLVKKIRSLEDQLHEKDGHISALNKTLNELRSQSAARLEEMSESSERLRVSEETCMRLQEEIERLSSSLLQAMEEKDGVVESERRYRDQLISLESSRSGDSSIKNRIVELEHAVQAKDSEIRELESSAKSLKDERTSLLDRIVSLESQLKATTRDLDQLRENAATQVASSEQLQRTLDEFTLREEQHASESQLLKEQLEEARSQLSLLTTEKNEVLSLANQKDRSLNESEADRHRLESEIAKLHEQLLERERVHSDFEKRVEAEMSKEKQKSNAFKDSQLKLRQLEAQVEDLRDQATESERLRSDIEKQLKEEAFKSQTLEAERNKLEEKIQKLSAEMDRLKSESIHTQSESVTTLRLEYEAKIESLQKEMEHVGRDLISKESEWMQKELELERLQLLVSERDDKLVVLSHDLEALRTSRESDIAAKESSLSTQLAEYTRKNLNLEDEVQRYSQIVSSLKADIDRSDASFADLSSKLQVAEADAAHWKAEYEKLKEQSSDQASLVEKLRSDINGLSQERDQLTESGAAMEAALSKAEAESQQLSSKMVELVNGIEERDLLIGELEATVNELLTKLKEIEAVSSNVGPDLEKALEQVAQQEQGLMALNQENLKLASTLKTAEGTISHLTSEGDTLKTSNEQLVSRIRDLESKLKHLETENAKISALEDRLKQMDLEKHQLASQLSQLEAELEERKQAFHSLQTESAASLQAMESERSLLMAQLEQAEKASQELGYDVDRLQAELKQSKEHRETHSKRWMDLEETLSKTTNSRDNALRESALFKSQWENVSRELESSKAAFTTRSREFESQIQTLSLEKQAALTNYQRVVSEKDSLQRKLQQVESSFEKKEKELELLQSSLAKEETQLKDAVQKVVQLEKSLADSQLKVLKAEKSIADKERELESIKAKHETADSSLKDSIQKVSSLEKALRETDSQLVDARKSLETTRTEFESLKAVHSMDETRLNEARSKIQTLEATVAGLESKRKEDESIRKHLSELEDLTKNQHEELRGLEDNLRAKEMALDKAIESQKKADSFLSAVRNDLHSTREKLKTEQQRYREEFEKRQASEATVSQLEKVASDLKIELSRLETSHNTATKDLQDRTSKIADLTTSLASLEQLYDTVLREKNLLLEKLSSVETSLAEREETLRFAEERLVMLQTDSNQLKVTSAKLDDLQEQFDNQTAIIHDISSENRSLYSECEGLKKEKTRLEVEAAETSHNLQLMKERITKLDNILNVTLLEKEEDEKKIIELFAEIESLKASTSRLEREKDALDAWVRELENRCSDLNKVKENMKELENQHQGALARNLVLEGLCDRLKNEITNVMERMEEYEKNMSDSVNSYESNIAMLHAQITDLNTERDSKEKEAKSLRLQIDQISTERERLEMDLMSAVTRNQELDSHVRTIREAQISKLREVEQVLKDSTLEKESNAAKIAMLEARVFSTEREAEEAKDRLYESDTKLSEIRLKADDDRAFYEKQVATLKQHVETSVQKELELTQKVRDLERDVERLRESLAKAAADSFKSASTSMGPPSIGAMSFLDISNAGLGMASQSPTPLSRGSKAGIASQPNQAASGSNSVRGLQLAASLNSPSSNAGGTQFEDAYKKMNADLFNFLSDLEMERKY